MNHIKNTLPDIKAKITQMVKESEAEMKSYGDSNINISKGKKKTIEQKKMLKKKETSYLNN